MKKVNLSKMLNLISVFIYLLATALTSYLLIRFIGRAHTEGIGIDVMILIFVNTIEGAIVFLLNLTGILTLMIGKKPNEEDVKVQYKKQTIWMAMTIVVSLLTFIIQLMIV